MFLKPFYTVSKRFVVEFRKECDLYVSVKH